jgi:hypothetical protein
MNMDEPPSEDFVDGEKDDEGEEEDNRSQGSPMDGMTALRVVQI